MALYTEPSKLAASDDGVEMQKSLALRTALTSLWTGGTNIPVQHGADSSAVIYRLIEAAKQCDLDPITSQADLSV